MVEWFQRNHQLLSNVVMVIALVTTGFQIWGKRKVIRASLSRILNWLESLVVPEYREAYQRRKLRTMRMKLRYLSRFSHKDEMERLSAIYSRLSTVLYMLVMDALILVVLILVFLIFAFSTLEKEILHEPIKQPSVGGHHYVLIVSVCLMAFATFGPIVDMGGQALYLSRRYRVLRIRRLRRKLRTVVASQGAKKQPLIAA
jgi:hypothetical protein